MALMTGLPPARVMSTIPLTGLAARELARLKPEDLTAVLNLLKTLKRGGEK